MVIVAVHTVRRHTLTVFLIMGELIGLPAARSQWVTTGLNAIDVPVDPRTIALGESFVALPGNSMALEENAAGLADLRGVGIMVAQRQLNWLALPPDTRYYSASGFVSTDIGTFGILYNRLNLGEFDVTSPSGPTPYVRVETHNHLLALGFARRMTGRFSAGVALKAYTQAENVVQGNPGNFLYETQGSLMIDFGALYAFPGLFDLRSLENRLDIGLSLQNFGTDFREKSGDPSSPTGVQEYPVKIPRYLRLGACYVISLPPSMPEDLTPFVVTLTGEYRALLNPTEWQESDRDFWGFGVEVSVLEVLSGRIGGFLQPYSSIYGSRAVPSLRYGVGATLPLQKLGLDVPLRISLDYAGIPLTERSLIFSPPFVTTSTLRSFSLQIVYTDTVF